MNKNRAIPEGFMTVGEVAKKMNTTVRTLQYYDKEGLLSPSAESEGGRRLYTDKDVIKLHQILSMKYLGFSLGDIKNRLIALDTPQDVASMLTEHAAAIREKVETLRDSLHAIEALKEEVLQMQSVNFKKYADIIVSLQMKNEMYWMIKHLDDQFLDHVRNRFGNIGNDMGIVETQMRIYEEAIRLETEGVSPDSERGIALAKEFWDMITTFTGGDMSLLPKMMELEKTMDSWNNVEWRDLHTKAHVFLEPALGAYFEQINYNPFPEGEEST